MAPVRSKTESARARAIPVNRHQEGSGTQLAIYRKTLSCEVKPPAVGRCGTWGGARNSAGRVNDHLTRQQCQRLIEAVEHASLLGLAFNRHWTVHYERAGIADVDGAQFVGHLLRLASAFARRNHGTIAAVWVRENGEHKGAHVHILLHLPAGLSLKNRTRRWIQTAGGICRRRVSKVRSIGGSLANLDPTSSHYHANASALLAYLLKGASGEASTAHGLSRYGEGGTIVGKRAGWTQNVGEAARRGSDKSVRARIGVG